MLSYQRVHGLPRSWSLADGPKEALLARISRGWPSFGRINPSPQRDAVVATRVGPEVGIFEGQLTQKYEILKQSLGLTYFIYFEHL